MNLNKIKKKIITIFATVEQLGNFWGFFTPQYIFFF